LERTLLDIDYTNEALQISNKSFLHNVENYIFILKTALWHLVLSFMPSPRCSSHALSLNRRWSYIDGLRGVAATFVFAHHCHMQNGYRATFCTFLGLFLGWNGNGIINTLYISSGYDFFHLMNSV
jgi:hypothetical protein